MQFKKNISWIDDGGPHTDVVASSRVRLARNLAGFPFVRKAGPTELAELVNYLKRILLDSNISDEMIWVDLNAASESDRELLVERHLISRQHAEAECTRGVAVSGDESLSVMVNEEDHLRMQSLASGLQFEQVYERINAVDDAIESQIDYAYDNRWGYLTACPTNVGTGIRFSAMMHLPALKITNEIDRVRRAAKDMHLAVRGYYGEGSDAAGDFYQISNQVTLGRSEQDLLRDFNEHILPQVIEYERQARTLLVKRNAALLDDRVHRALAVLRAARMLGAEEAMKLLSRVRLGVYLERLNDVNLATVNGLFVQVQTGHLQRQSDKKLSSDKLRATRADLVRRALS